MAARKNTVRQPATPIKPAVKPEAAAAPVARVYDEGTLALGQTDAELDAIDALLAADDDAQPVAEPVATPEADQITMLSNMVAELQAKLASLTGPAAPSPAVTPTTLAVVTPVVPRNTAQTKRELTAAERNSTLAQLEQQLAYYRSIKDTKNAKKIRARMRSLGHYRSTDGAYGSDK